MTEQTAGTRASGRNPFKTPRVLEKVTPERIAGLVPFALWIIFAVAFSIAEPILDKAFHAFELPLPPITFFLTEKPAVVVPVIAGAALTLATNGLKRSTLRRILNLISFAFLAAVVWLCVMAFTVPFIPIY